MEASDLLLGCKEELSQFPFCKSKSLLLELQVASVSMIVYIKFDNASRN
jgi:hypothetical protein